jgi:hypothetical protein
MEQAMSSQRQIDRLRAPLIVTYGTNDTPEFQHQARDFATAVKAAGKPVELIRAVEFWASGPSLTYDPPAKYEGSTGIESGPSARIRSAKKPAYF